MQGTAAYNAIWVTDRVGDADGRAGHRFSGRVALRARSALYVGIGIGSWESATTLSLGGMVLEGEITSLSSAVVGGPYAQVYPIARAPFFLRAGVGLAATRTYYPASHDGLLLMYLVTATRLAPTAGLGVDLGVGRHLAVTGAVDFTRLVGVEGGRELDSGVTASVGLTLR